MNFILFKKVSEFCDTLFGVHLLNLLVGVLGLIFFKLKLYVLYSVTRKVTTCNHRKPWQKRGLKAKLQIVDQYVRPTGNALEKECDAEMNKLLKELKGILTDLGTGTSIIGEIEKTYKEQKEIKMAELYNQYSPKLQ